MRCGMTTFKPSTCPHTTEPLGGGTRQYTCTLSAMSFPSLFVLGDLQSCPFNADQYLTLQVSPMKNVLLTKNSCKGRCFKQSPTLFGLIVLPNDNVTLRPLKSDSMFYLRVHTQKNKWHQNGAFGALIDRPKMVPFGAPFWCHFPKGHCFYEKMDPLCKEEPFSKTAPLRHQFGSTFFLSVPFFL